MAKDKQADPDLPAEMAGIAAAFYGAMLDMEIPGNRAGGLENGPYFTPGQAFELTRVFLYEAVKDADIL